MTEEELSLRQEMDRLISIADRIVDYALELESAAKDMREDAERRKSTVEPTWDEISRIARTIDRVDDEAGVRSMLMFRISEMCADMQFILSGV